MTIPRFCPGKSIAFMRGELKSVRGSYLFFLEIGISISTGGVWANPKVQIKKTIVLNGRFFHMKILTGKDFTDRIMLQKMQFFLRVNLDWMLDVVMPDILYPLQTWGQK